VQQELERLLRGLSTFGLAKVLCGLAVGIASLAARGDLWATRMPLLVSHVLVFGAVGLFLVVMGRQDIRATALGTLLVLVASLFADPVALAHLSGSSALEAVLRALLAVQVDAFIPFVLWVFVTQFPSSSQQRLSPGHLRGLTVGCFALGVILLSANFAAALSPQSWNLGRTLGPLSRRSPTSWYWPSQYVLCLGALGYLVSKRKLGLPEDQRRARLLLWMLVVGASPMILWSLLTSLSETADRLLPLRLAGWVIYPSLLAVPFGVAYAVVARQALEIRWFVRQVIQYALARYTAIVLAGTPVILLFVLAYQRRDQVIDDALFTPGILFLGLISVAGILAIQSREGLLDQIDRWFFREMYDARRTLGLLIEQCRWVADRVELASVVRSEVNRALHPQATWLLLFDESSRSFASPLDGAGSLPADAALIAALQRSEGYLDCNLESGAGVPGLSLGERHWLVDARVRYLLPLRDGRQALVGLLALGEKQSGLPFGREDWTLLAAVAAAIEMSIAYHGIRTRDADAAAPGGHLLEQRAMECDRCGRVHPSEATFCRACSQPLVEAPLPHSTAGKFMLDQRIGSGGMGVVYRAVDLELDRVVALKTLPYMSPEEGLRLRREARFMAAVSHPHLAQIYGVETWHGHPFLVVEFLAGGTLAARLESGPLSLPEAFELGSKIGGAVEAIHSAGVLHRDIKPSNIGYAQGTTPKLLDFGLARLTQGPLLIRADAGDAGTTLGARTDASQPSVGSTVGHGTPPYMSPEALQGSRPEPGFDLWSLSVVLYESVTGVNPFVDSDPFRARERILRGEAPDIRTFLPTAPPQVAAFFKRALSGNQIERPRTARAFVMQLSALPTYSPITSAGHIPQSA
jgi:hypothetical protein